MKKTNGRGGLKRGELSEGNVGVRKEKIVNWQ